MPRFRVVFEFEARDEREAIHLISRPELLRDSAVMTIQNVDQLITLRNAAILSPLFVAALVICYCWWGW